MSIRLLALLSVACCVSEIRGADYGSLPKPSASDADRWEKAISAFELKDKESPPAPEGILFIGSSSIRRWSSLADDFPKKPVFNRGFGGSQIADSLHFADRIVLPYRPRQIVMFAGSNDINAGKSPRQVLADFIAFCAKVHKALPKTQISWVPITPCEKRWSQFEKVKEANGLVAKFCGTDKRLDYINTFDEMLGADGKPRPDIFAKDLLHLNATGYQVWTKIVKPFLK